MLKFWLSRLTRGWKGKKLSQKLKISVCCTLYFRNHISYDLHLWYTCMYKMIISPGIFFISIKILISKIIRGEVKGQKINPKWQIFFVCLAPYFRNRTWSDCDFWWACVKWWCLQQIFSFFKILIIGVFRGIKGKNDLKLPIWLCFALFSEKH